MDAKSHPRIPPSKRWPGFYGRYVRGHECAVSRQAAANALIPDPTVKVFFNIGSDRIGTLLFFVIKHTYGKTVETGSSGKAYAAGKV